MNYRKDMKQGDTGEPLRAVIVNADTRAPVNVTGAEVRFKMIQVNDDSTTTELVNDTGSVESGSAGLIVYDWKAGDTSAVGVHHAYFEVEYETGVIETYPRKGAIEISIEAVD